MLSFLKIEINRYRSLNFRSKKDILKTIILNIIIVLLIKNIFKDALYEEYIISYSLVWYIMSLEMSVIKEISEDYNNKIIKYYDENIDNVYYSRYIIHTIKSLVILYIILSVSYMFDIISNNINLYDILILFVGALSIFFLNYILALIYTLKKKYINLFNIFRVIIIYILASNTNRFIPFGGICNLILNKLIYGVEYNFIEIVKILIPMFVYILIGRFIIYIINTKYKKNICN